jgi:hypothetical protein
MVPELDCHAALAWRAMASLFFDRLTTTESMGQVVTLMHSI